MFYHILFPLRRIYSPFNLFQYISFRTAGALITALLISFIFYPWFIEYMKQKKIGDEVRSDTPESHKKKRGTPSMGGILIIISVLLSSFFWMRFHSPLILLIFVISLCFGIVGFIDDYLKWARRNSKGLSVRMRLIAEFSVSIISLLLFYLLGYLDTTLPIPFFKNLHPDLGIFYILFASFIIVGCANAVNITDGLDGLATGPVMTTAMALSVLAYLSGNIKFATYLNIPYISGMGEMTIFCWAIVGAGLGFLWFNTFPGSIYMGDCGSLSLGGTLATISILSKNELILGLIGGVFLIEILTVVIQVVYFRLTGGKRVFPKTPIHHTFEERFKWEEPKIIVRFWIISIIFALAGLLTLKLR